MVAVADVGGHSGAVVPQPDRREAERLGAVHQARPSREGAVVGAERVVRVPVVGRPEAEVVVVLHAHVGRLVRDLARGLAREQLGARRGRALRVVALEPAVRRERRAALDELAHPDGLVVLLVVGLVPGQEREVHRGAPPGRLPVRAGGRERVHLPEAVVDPPRMERLVRPVGAVRAPVDELHPRRRLLVRQLEVRELREVRDRAAPAGASGLRRRRREPAYDPCRTRSLHQRLERGAGEQRLSRLDRVVLRRVPELVGVGGAGGERQPGQQHDCTDETPHVAQSPTWVADCAPVATRPRARAGGRPTAAPPRAARRGSGASPRPPGGRRSARPWGGRRRHGRAAPTWRAGRSR